MPLTEVPRDRALTKDQFHAALRAWLDETRDATVQPEVGFGRTAWVHVRDGGRLLALNADTTRDGVRAYLELLDARAGDLAWDIVATTQGKRTKVAFGPERVKLPGFYLYLHE